MNEDQVQDSGAAAEPIIEAPVAPSGDNGEFTAADKQELDEWEQAAVDVFANSGVKKVEDGGNDEQSKSAQGAENGKTAQGDNQAQKPNAGQGDGDAANQGGEGQKQNGQGENEAESAEPTDAISRLSQREQQQAVDYMQNDVRSKMFVEQNEQGQSILRAEDGTVYHLDQSGKAILADKDGDPLDSLDKVMSHINPSTGRPFTEEEAGMWLLQAQAKLREDVSNIGSRINDIAQTNLTLKDEADIINYQFGALLRHPDFKDVRDNLWTQYQKTLTVDPKTGVIVKAPVSMEQFYKTALEPYARMGRQLANQQAQQVQQQQQQQEQAQTAKQQRRADRSDIYGGGKTDMRTDDTKEWDAAAMSAFGADTLKSAGLIK